MNYMPEVLKMLNLEVGEKFNIKEFDNNPYHFDCEYILVDSKENDMAFQNIAQILRGAIEIEKLPWKPKDGDRYYYIPPYGKKGVTNWISCEIDFYRFNMKNYFYKEGEITDEIKQRILQEMKGKYEND